MNRNLVYRSRPMMKASHLNKRLNVYRNIRLWILCLLAGMFIHPAKALTGDPLEALSQRFDQFESLSGTFKQTLVDDSNVALQDSEGSFAILKPGYFRWDTQSPFPQLLVSDLETLWLYDPDLEQVTIQPYSTRADQSPALLLSGDKERIGSHYQVSQGETEDDFILVPLDKESPFTQIHLLFDQGRLSKMVLNDSLQQVTTFTLDSLQTNQPFEKAFFQFTPPDGVDVLIDE